MGKVQYSFILLLTIMFISCKKEPVTQNPVPDYQETRNARISGIELTDKDFRQYFIYGEDGLLNSVKREGDTGFLYPEANVLNVYHEYDHIRFYNFWDDSDEGFWKNVKVFHKAKHITGGTFTVRYLPFPVSLIRGYKFNYSPLKTIENVDLNFITDTMPYPGITDIQYDKNKIVQYTMNNNYQPITPILFGESGNIEELTMVFSYIPQQFISSDIKKLINNGHLNFVRIGDNNYVDWQNLVYGLSGYELPMKEENEIISEIRIRGYSKEDNSLLLDSTVTFDYQVDTLNRKISFGNQIVSYEFIE